MSEMVPRFQCPPLSFMLKPPKNVTKERERIVVTPSKYPYTEVMFLAAVADLPTRT